MRLTEVRVVLWANARRESERRKISVTVCKRARACGVITGCRVVPDFFALSFRRHVRNLRPEGFLPSVEMTGKEVALSGEVVKKTREVVEMTISCARNGIDDFSAIRAISKVIE